MCSQQGDDKTNEKNYERNAKMGARRLIRRGFFPKTIIVEFPLCARPLFRLRRFPLFVRSEWRGIKAQAPECALQVDL